jgi:hypothetical protein
MKLRFSRHSLLVSAINTIATKVIAGLNETIGAGDWIRIAPYGEHGNKVGLQVFDRAGAEAMVKAFNSVETKLSTLFRGLPIYEGHPDDEGWKRANPGIRAAAVGRVKKLETRDDGLWALAAWNEAGERLVRGETPAYTAQSPHWGMLPIPGRPKAFQPVELWSIGLTNQPNISGTEMGLNEIDTASPMKEILIKLLAAHGISVAADAADDAIIAAATDAIAKAGPAKAAAEGEMAAAKNEAATLKTQLTAAQNELTGLKADLVKATAAGAAERAARATAVITAAINEGKLTEAQRAEFTTALVGATDFDAKAKEIGQMRKAINTQNKVAGAADRKGESAVDNTKLTAINEAVTKKAKEANLSHHDAYMAVKREQPALFAATNG